MAGLILAKLKRRKENKKNYGFVIMSLLKGLKETTKRKFSEYQQNREIERAIYKTTYEEELKKFKAQQQKARYEAIRKQAMETARQGGTLGKIANNLSQMGESEIKQFTQQPKKKKKKYQFDMWDLGY